MSVFPQFPTIRVLPHPCNIKYYKHSFIVNERGFTGDAVLVLSFSEVSPYVSLTTEVRKEKIFFLSFLDSSFSF